MAEAIASTDYPHWIPAGAAPPEGTTTGERPQSDPAPGDMPAVPAAAPSTPPALPPGWAAAADWLSAAPPVLLGDAHTGHFFLITPEVFVYGGQLFYEPPRQPYGHFSYHSFRGSATLTPNVQWGEMYKTVTIDRWPLPWVRVIINVRQDSSGAIRGTGALTFHQSTYLGGPGDEKSYWEFDTPDLSQGGSYQSLHIPPYDLNIVLTTLLM